MERSITLGADAARERRAPAEAPPICAIILTKPPAEEETAGGTASREKRPRRTCTGKAQMPIHR